MLEPGSSTVVTTIQGGDPRASVANMSFGRGGAGKCFRDLLLANRNHTWSHVFPHTLSYNTPALSLHDTNQPITSAGNMSKDDQFLPSASISTANSTPPGASTPRSGRNIPPKQPETFATGRGGKGNVGRLGPESGSGRLPLTVSLSLSRSLDRSSSRSGSVSTESSGARRTRYMYGRGGAANIACEEEEEVRRLTVRSRGWERDEDEDAGVFENDEEGHDKAVLGVGVRTTLRSPAVQLPRGRIPDKEWKEAPLRDVTAMETRLRDRGRMPGHASEESRPSAGAATDSALAPTDQRGISVHKGVRVEQYDYRGHNRSELAQAEIDRARASEAQTKGLADVGRDFLGRRLKLGRRKKKGEASEGR